MSQSPTNSEPLEAVIFDMDGVVTRTARLHQEAWTTVFDDFLAKRPAQADEDHRPFSEADYRTYVDGRPRYDGIRAFLAARYIEIPEGSADDAPTSGTVLVLGHRKNEFFRELVSRRGVEVDEAALKLIRRLRDAGLRVGIATSSQNGALILESAGLDALFDASVDGVTSIDLDLRGKPDPDIFIECARRLGARPERAVVVEDAESGVAAGRSGSFGIVIGVDRGGNWLRLREAGADWIVRDMAELSADRILDYWANRADALPNVLYEWRKVAQQLGGRSPTLFLDFDGTLTPIVDHPDLALLNPEMRASLAAVAQAWPTQIISGRGLEDVQGRIGLETIWYAASHGYDIAAPRGTPGSRQIAPEVEPAVHRTADELREATRSFEGVLIEDKRYSVALHYRLADPTRIPEIEAIVDRIISSQPALKKALGKKVFELRPARDWDKGKALLSLLSMSEQSDVFPIYVGDDTTDEDAFAVLTEAGLGVLVTELPRPTAARYSLQNPFEVRLFLEQLAQLRARGRDE